MAESEMEYQTLMLPLDGAYQKKIAELAAQGWSLIEGTAPYAVFNLCRQPPSVNLFKVAVDEAGVTVIKGGGESASVEGE